MTNLALDGMNRVADALAAFDDVKAVHTADGSGNPVDVYQALIPAVEVAGMASISGEPLSYTHRIERRHVVGGIEIYWNSTQTGEGWFARLSGGPVEPVPNGSVAIGEPQEVEEVWQRIAARIEARG